MHGPGDHALKSRAATGTVRGRDGLPDSGIIETGSVGVVRDRHGAKGWGVLDSDVTPGGAGLSSRSCTWPATPQLRHGNE